MAAYVHTTLIVEGKSEKLDEFIRLVAGNRGEALSFQKIAPLERRGNGDLLAHLKKLWGTTTDAQDVEFTRISPERAVIFFETANTFPHAIIERLVDLFDGLNFRGHFSIETGGLFGAFNGKQAESVTDIDLRLAPEEKTLLNSMPAIQSYISLVAELESAGRSLTSQGFDRKGGIKAEVIGPKGSEATLILGADGRVAKISNDQGNNIARLIALESFQTTEPRQQTNQQPRRHPK
jgi:hypothetical protein